MRKITIKAVTIQAGSDSRSNGPASENTQTKDSSLSNSGNNASSAVNSRLGRKITATSASKGSSGNKRSRTETPMAPAPTEVSVTSVPMTAPNTTGRLQWRACVALSSWLSASVRGSCLPRAAL